MTAVLQKWGNSSGIRIPKQVLVDLNIKVNDKLLITSVNDEIVIKDQNDKEVNAANYCYDEESLKDICNKYKNTDKEFFIATLKNKSTWVVNTDKEYKLNEYRINDEYLKCEDQSYTYKEIVDLLEAGETIIIIINK